MRAGSTRQGMRTAATLVALAAVAMPAAASPAGPQVVVPHGPLPGGIVAIEKLVAVEKINVVALDRITRHRVALAELAGQLADVRVAVARDRADLSLIDRAVGWRNLDARPCAPEGRWDVVADALVSAARLPARAGLVAEHLMGAFAKIAPRVAGALF